MKKILALFIVVAIVVFVAYQVLVYYDNNFRYGRMRETPGVKPHEEPLLILEKGIVPVSGGDAVLLAADTNALQPAVDMSAPAAIERGKSVYFTFCAQCHGNNYDGRGTVGQSFHPLPTSLRSETVQSKTNGELFKSVSYGVKDGRQPALHTTISIDDRWRVIAFVKSLGQK